MSMIGEYFRVTAAQLDRAIEDPDWALAYIEDTFDAEESADSMGGEDGPPPAGARHFSTDKAWHLLDFLLRRVDFPVDVVHGENPLGDAGDWGYGPPCHLPVDRVRLAAEALSGLTYDRLLDGVDPRDLTAAEIYPLGWEDSASLDWARDWFAGLTTYFEAAARDGHAVVVWLD
ncbi:YfbM family protein [Streptomyces sp. NPDC046203]|uniref:YfbM family protein n=1 Tax=Streptomyces sp. NPDC046203 TaxID=3154602 RepID=UPI0033E6CB22